MPQTSLSIRGPSFLINGKLTYSEIDGGKPGAHGLLMNARFIQGIYDDAADRSRYERWGFGSWDPEDHTDRLIAALPEWYSYGLRAFTVGFQGGGPCFTIDNATIDNNPFGEDGATIDQAYCRRMDRLIRAADEIGMAVIVSLFYGMQARRIVDGAGIRRAVSRASRFLKEGGYTNVIMEIANEYDIPPFRDHPILQEPEGMAWLIDYAREESGGLPVGSSGGGGHRDRQVVDASDVVLIHGNGQTRGHYNNMVREVQRWAPEKPVVCNEDSQAIGQLAVCEKTRTSWGYYNNMAKQEPPVRWEILPGEDRFFALRMARMIGIPAAAAEEAALQPEARYHLHGFEPHLEYGGMRWPRLASLDPETIDHVEFFRGGSSIYTCYDEPFTVNYRSNWNQAGIAVRSGERWEAIVHLRDGSQLERGAVCP